MALAHVWGAFGRLSARRGSGFGISPIGFADIEAFTRLTGARLSPWEVRLIEQLDDLFRAEHGKLR